MTELRLPWPPKELSPNARVHWSKKAPIAKAYKKACWALTLEAGLVVPDSGDIHLFVDYYPPDRRQRDQDNMISASKALFDGIAAALGVNDKRFRLHPFVQDATGGYVRVRITGMPESDAAMQVWGR